MNLNSSRTIFVILCMIPTYTYLLYFSPFHFPGTFLKTLAFTWIFCITHDIWYNTDSRKQRLALNWLFGRDGFDMQRLKSFRSPTAYQQACPLFSVVPPEIKNIIYDYVFSDYEDLDHPYDMDTCYRRPGYFGPRITHTALLRTCQAIYNETWYMPFTKAQHTFYYTSRERCPPRKTTNEQVKKVMAMIQRLHPDVDQKRIGTGTAQIFAQLYLIEKTGALQRTLDIPNFFPSSVTVTIRHTDCWGWEGSTRVYSNAQWIRDTIVPSHVKTFRIQWESLKARKAEVDWMTEHIIKTWYLKRDDEVVLASNSPAETQVWEGSSTWNDRRWVRDEVDEKPEVLEFYLATVTFRPLEVSLSDKNKLPEQPDLSVPAHVACGAHSRAPYITTKRLQEAGVPSGTSASRALQMVGGRHE